MTEPAGVIHDIGYQRYQGTRLGRGYAAGSLFVHSLRTAYGLGRSAKAKIFPWLVAGIMLGVAAVVTAIRAATGLPVMDYVDFPDGVFLLVILFCAVVAPELVSRDLRSGVLALYFSRPLRRSDYALAKLGGLTSAVLLLLAGPLLVMFLGGVFAIDLTSEGWAAVWDEGTDFLPGLAYAAINAVLYASLALLIASLVGRRAVAAGAIVAVFLVTTPVFGVLMAAGGETVQQLAGLVSPSTLVAGVQHWLFDTDTGAPFPGDYGPLYGGVTLALVVVCVALLLERYRKVQQ